MPTPYVSNWQTIRAALEKAYEELGWKINPSGQSFQDNHWELAVSVYNQAQANVMEGQKCQGRNCNTKLNYHTVIRCLDCRMAMCEYCAKPHFGDGHANRAKLAYG